MGRIISFIRSNLFWAAVALAVVGIAFAYFFVARDMAARVDALRAEQRDNLDKLRKKAELKEIPNSDMLKAAKAEEKKLERMYGQFLLTFAPLSGRLSRDFAPLKGVKDEAQFGPGEQYKWWDEYMQRTGRLRREVRDRFDAPNSVLPNIASRLKDSKVSMAGARQRQREYWIMEAAVRAVSDASPEAAPLIDTLTSVFVGPLTGRPPGKPLVHDWVVLSPFSLRVQTKYEHLGRFIAGLQNSPQRLVVSSCVVSRYAPPARAGVRTAAVGRPVDVTLHCDLLELRPAVQAVSFSGPRFKTAGDIRKWVKQRAAELDAAAKVVVQAIPELAERTTMGNRADLVQLEQKARAGLETRLKEIDDGAAQLLADLRAAALGEGSDTLTPEQEAKVRELHVQTLAKKRADAEKECQKALRDIAVKGASFARLYDRFYSVVPQKAYYIGTSASDTRYLIARGPDRSKGIGGRWWLARQEGGKTYKKSATLATMRDYLEKGPPAQEAIAVDLKAPEKVTLLVDSVGRQVVRVLVREPAGQWRVYPVVKVNGKPVAVSDVAVRFAYVIEAAARKINSPAFDASASRVHITPAAEMDPGTVKAYAVPIAAGSGSELSIDAGLRKK